MVLSFEFETRFEAMIKQAKASVCAEIDVKAQSLRELFNWEIGRQREELLETINSIGLTTNQKPVLVKSEQADNQRNDGFNAESRYCDSQQQKKAPIDTTNGSQPIHDTLNNQLMNPQTLNNHINQSLQSQQANEIPIKVETEEEDEEVELDCLDDDCNCPDCQSSSGTSKFDSNQKGQEDCELIQHPNNLNDEAPVAGKKRKLPNEVNPSSPQSGSSSSASGYRFPLSRPSIQDLNLNLANNPPVNNANSTVACPYPGCGRILANGHHLRRHLLIHNTNRPYRCLWEACTYSSNRNDHMKEHIRMAHFRLPRTKKEILERGLTEPADPRQWIGVNAELL